MKVDYHSNFLKHYKKRIAPNHRLVEEFRESLMLFLEEPEHSVLGDHPLRKDRSWWRAFSVTEDIRVVYRKTKYGILLYDIGSHSQVYGGQP